MYLSTVFFVLILLFFIWRGYQKGFIHSVTRMASWVVAYVAAIYLTRPMADAIFRYSSLNGLLVYFIAGGLVLLLTSFVVAQLITLLSKAVPEDIIKGKPSRIAGALVGSLVGIFVGLLMGYAINLLQATQLDTVANAFIDKSANKMVGAVAGKAVGIATEDPVAGQLLQDFATNPQDTLGHMKQLSTDSEVKDIFRDAEVKALLEKGDVDALLENDEFQEIVNNEHMQALFANAGEGSGKDTRQVAAETIVKSWSRADALSHDPRVAAIIADPGFQKQIQSADHAALLMDPKFRRLTEIIISNDVQAPVPDDSAKTMAKNSGSYSGSKKLSNKDVVKKSETRIYRWTDENGHQHFSDKPATR